MSPQRHWLNHAFGLEAKGTRVQNEFLGGLTSFLTMSYIIFVNPDILAMAGMDRDGLVVVTCLAAGLASIGMGLWANVPVCQAPGMGLNAFFTFTLVLSLGLSWQQALAVVFISGVAFVFLTFVGVRELIVHSIPPVLKKSTAVGIGLFIAFIGFKNIGLIIQNDATFVGITHHWPPALLLSLLGVAVMSVLIIKRIRGAILIGILSVYLAGVTVRTVTYFKDFAHHEGKPWFRAIPEPGSPMAELGLLKDDVLLSLDDHPFPDMTYLNKVAMDPPMELLYLKVNRLGKTVELEVNPAELTFLEQAVGLSPLPGWYGFSGLPTGFVAMPKNLGKSLFQLDFSGLWSASVFAIIFSFMFLDLFDSVGTLLAVGAKARLTDEEGNLPEINRALQADAVGTVVGALLGTSTTTSYIESAAGVEAGGRSGLTAVFCGLLFLLAMFFVPLISAVPTYAISPCLIAVGLAMMDHIDTIDFTDFEEGTPAFFTILLMPLTHNISIGLGFGFLSYTIIKMALGKFDEIHWMLYIICALFVANLAFGGV